MTHYSSLSEEILKNNLSETVESGGFDHDFVDEIDNEYVCCICLCVMKDPYQIVPCGHCCCRSCLHDLLRKYGDKTSCPIDRQPVKLDKIFPDNSCKRRILNLKIRCKEAAAGCTWQAELQRYNEHAESCLYAMVKCSNEGCSELLLRKVQDLHADLCVWRIVQCSQCLDKIRAFQLEEHKSEICPQECLPCENGCCAVIRRSQMKQHISNGCPETIVKCPLESYGCTAELSRKLLKTHFENSQSDHFEALCAEVSNLRKELAEVKALCVTGTRQSETNQSKAEFLHFIWNTPPVYELASHGEVYSAPYSTGPRGYCFVVIISRRDHDTVLSIKLVPGIYDNLLPWPFRCNFSLVLLDQLNQGEKCHLKKHVDFSDFESDSQVPQLYHQPRYSDDRPTGVYPLLNILNDTLADRRYTPDGSALILVKVKPYNCEENLDI